MLKMLLIILSDLVVSSTALAQGLNTSPTEVDHAIPTDSSLPLTATSETSESPVLGGSDALDATEKQNPIKDDAYLHPIDSITPYTLKKVNGFMLNPYRPYPFQAGLSLVSRTNLQRKLTRYLGYTGRFLT